MPNLLKCSYFVSSVFYYLKINTTDNQHFTFILIIILIIVYSVLKYCVHLYQINIKTKTLCK